MRIRILVLVLVALLGLAACGEPSLAPGGDAEGPDTPVTGSPDDGDRVDPEAEPELVEPRPGMANVQPRPWEEAVVADDGRTVEIRFWSGVEPCSVLDRVEVDAAPEQVVITLFEGSDPAEPDAVCIEIAKRKAVRVTLDEPVGDREIVDGAAQDTTGGGTSGNHGIAEGEPHPDSGTPPPTAGEPQEPQAPAEPQEPATVTDSRAVPWDRHDGTPTSDQVTVFWWSGVEPCTVLDRVEVAESGTEVVITVYEGTGDPDAVCAAVAVEKSHTVTLSAPLGARVVRDGAK